MKSKLWLWAGALVLVCATTGHAAERDAVSTLNMPHGWVWPPSPPMMQRGTACLRELAEAGVDFERLDHPVGQVMNPVRIPSRHVGPVALKSERTDKLPVMDCELALALAHEAPALRDLGVRALILGRVYHARRARLRGRSVNLRSRHSLGLAVDIRGFITRRGHRLTIWRDYQNPLVQRVEAQLLTSDIFRAVVTPKNDRAHRDHFHLSAKLTIDPGHPDNHIEVRDLLRAAVLESPRPGTARHRANRP